MRVSIAVVCLALLLSACGFKPRGQLAGLESPGRIEVTAADPYDPLVLELGRALARFGADPGDSDPAMRLRVLSATTRTVPLSLDSQALVREYQVIYTVRFKLDAADGKEMLAPRDIELTREYTFDSFASAGSPAEQAVIERELRRDMAAAVLRQLDVVLRRAD